ncbi:unnamed protein product [Caenorhabditis angaria]|uniref:Uncharacterized protein n=1 Tax=Caenorhabditis angaria TaxID=860376 RepID=A0A9P1MXH5_9PELO|nr:unnamed protein product [Caenorhabditis angaria]
MRLVLRLARPVGRRFFSSAESATASYTLPENGTLYEIDRDATKQLNFRTHLPSGLRKQLDTIGELVTLVREPLLEVSSCMRAVDKTIPTLRLVLWGPFGTGKTVTLNQAVHHAYQNQWAIVNLRSAMDLTRQVKEIEMCTYVPGRINDPSNAISILQNFKQQNQHIWKKLAELQTERDYEWSKSEKTAQNKPITDIVEMGISAPFLATDCVGALFRELRRHAKNDGIKVLVAIDDANSLWGKTLVKRADRTYAQPHDLSLVVHFRRMISNDWSNGCVLMVADKKEVSDANNQLEVPRITPLELFGEEGFEHIEPVIPIETTNYTEKETDAIFEYYVKKNWLASEAARSEDGRKQLMYLSAFNPHYYERLLMLKFRLGIISVRKSSSQWVKSAESSVNVEKMFIEPEVQKLLTELTEIDMENKVFRPRRTSIQQRSHFALMTDERLEKTRERMQEEARRFLQFVPVKEPRQENVQILSKDKELEAFDTSKFVFTDITFDATDQDRTVVVREPDGTLRTANPEEHDRMNRTYYQKPNRPVQPPPLFEDPFLKDALDRNEHEFVLDWACWFYEPDDPSFIRLTHQIFDRINESEKFHVLTSTRHFGTFVFYLALNDNIPKLLNYFGGLGRLTDCANLIRLQKTLRPDWRVTIAQGDSNEKIVKDFIKQNQRFKDVIQDLLNFVNNGQLKADNQKHTRERIGGGGQSTSGAIGGTGDKRRARIHSGNIRSSDGPLGDLSDEYSVKVVKSEGTGETHEKPTKNDRKTGGRWGNRPKNDRNSKKNDEDE